MTPRVVAVTCGWNRAHVRAQHRLTFKSGGAYTSGHSVGVLPAATLHGGLTHMTTAHTHDHPHTHPQAASEMRGAALALLNSLDAAQKAAISYSYHGRRADVFWYYRRDEPARADAAGHDRGAAGTGLRVDGYA